MLVARPRPSPSAIVAAAAMVATLCGCRTGLDVSDTFDAPPDAAVDLAPRRDLAIPPDLTRPPPPPDLGGCIPTDRDAGVGECPCGEAGLCRVATGRLVVQTQSPGGTLRVVVMDDNGCRRMEVSQELPLGTPRWAADRERLAFVTGGRNSARLHIVRVAASGQVVCHTIDYTGVGATDVAWASPTDVWLFVPGSTAGGAPAQILRWKLGVGLIAGATTTVEAFRFDTAGEGPLALARQCATSDCAAEVLTRPSVLRSGGERTLLRSAAKVGSLRLSPDGAFAVFAAEGLVVAPLDGTPPLRLGGTGAQSPAFAWFGQSLVYTTELGQLEFRYLIGPRAGETFTVPPTWKRVYSPDWSPPPAECQPQSTSCY